MSEQFMGRELLQLECKVKNIRFFSTENGFTILDCREEETGARLVAKGYMPAVRKDTVYIFDGNWVEDRKYGRQFEIVSFDEVFPTTVEGIEGFLSSGLIKGIGPAYAKRIVETFGTDTLDIIEDTPERLLEVPGIGKGRMEKIKGSWEERREVKNIMTFLRGFNVTSNQACRIYKQYGKESIQKVKDNPYQLVDDIWGFGFKTVDKIALNIGIEPDKYERLRSGLMFVLEDAASQGHCYQPRSILLRKAAELLETDEESLAASLDRMVAENDVKTEDYPKIQGAYNVNNPLVYLDKYYYAEIGVSDCLYNIANGRSRLYFHNTDFIVDRVQLATGMQYDEVQQEAIRAAVNNKVLVITGGPGTGKTTTTKGIITAFSEARARILLAAPTGRAAKRLAESTGMKAITIHRLLEFDGNSHEFMRNEKEKLEGDVLLVDECSMVDILLMHSLLKAVPSNMTVILVGDIDQLPSVGAGNVLRDIINSRCFSVVRLTCIHRQAQQSGIVMGAYAVNNGTLPNLNNQSKDFFFMDMDALMKKQGASEYNAKEYAEEAARQIVLLVSAVIPRHFGYSPEDIQVLSPMRKGEVGVTALNNMIQKQVNQEADGINRGSYVFKPGDKVMQIRNNYDKKVFNGDIGKIISIDKDEQTLWVKYDGKRKENGVLVDNIVDYEFSELDELVLSYASTIHKAQGSEYPVVVMPVMMNHWMMLQRNLIYTGITRAKKLLIIVGTRTAMKTAVNNMVVQRRNTLLTERIQNCYYSKKYQKKGKNYVKGRNAVG